jgi:hypothetical protein
MLINSQRALDLTTDKCHGKEEDLTTEHGARATPCASASVLLVREVLLVGGGLGARPFDGISRNHFAQVGIRGIHPSGERRHSMNPRSIGWRGSADLEALQGANGCSP